MENLNINEQVEQEVEVSAAETEVNNEVENNDVDLLDLIAQNDSYKAQFESVIDRRITKAIQTNTKKHEEEIEKVRRRATMTAEELQSEKERELQQREQEIKNYEMKLAKIEYFKENDIPLDLIDYVVVDNEEDIAAKSQVLVDLINAQVEKAVVERLKQNGYEEPTTENTGKISIEDLKGLSTEEINKYWDKINK